MAWYGNIERLTELSPDYRRILYTGKLQLALMSLEPGEDIPWEVHAADQFFRVEQGQGVIITRIIVGERILENSYILEPGVGVVIPEGTHHYVRNTGDIALKLYTVYAPPTHEAEEFESRE